MKKPRFRWKHAIILFLVLLAGTALYQVVFVSDIPITDPNVNEKPLGTLNFENSYLVNRWADSMQVESGRLVVPENRGAENPNHIEIFFNRIPTTAENPMSPIFFLAGGPGSSASAVSMTEYYYVFKKLSKHADVILLDQRGTGYSIPNLSCRNSLSSPTDITENAQQAIMDNLVVASAKCGEEFEDMGIDLTAYNSTESAMDIEAIRSALGYKKITLYGYSYGTELAQHYSKKFESRLDKLILAGPIAPDHGLKMPMDVQAQFEAMDSLVRADKKLSKYVPNFMELVRSTHEKLKENPQYIQVPMQDAFDDEGVEQVIGNLVANVKPTWNMTMTDDHLQMMISDKVGQDRWIQRMPEIYYKMSVGEYRFIGNQLRNFRRRRLPNAVFFTVNGHSGYSEEQWNKSLEQSERSVFSHFGISYGRYPEVYNAFGIKKVGKVNDAVYGETPLLLINGTLDGRTPVRLADEIAARFPNNRRILIQNRGHNKLMNNEVFDSMLLFLKDSLIEDRVIKKKLEFRNPVPYKYSMADTLLKIIDEASVEKALQTYEKLAIEYEEVDDYIYDFGSWELHKVAEALIPLEKYDEAVAVMGFALKKFPEDEYLYFYLALTYEKMGKNNLARTFARKGLEVDYFEGNSHALLSRLE